MSEPSTAGPLQPSVGPRTISAGRNRREARENVLDALREMLASPVEVRDGGAREEVNIRLDLTRTHDRGRQL